MGLHSVTLNVTLKVQAEDEYTACETAEDFIRQADKLHGTAQCHIQDIVIEDVIQDIEIDGRVRHTGVWTIRAEVEVWLNARYKVEAVDTAKAFIHRADTIDSVRLCEIQDVWVALIMTPEEEME